MLLLLLVSKLIFSSFQLDCVLNYSLSLYRHACACLCIYVRYSLQRFFLFFFFIDVISKIRIKIFRNSFLNWNSLFFFIFFSLFNQVREEINLERERAVGRKTSSQTRLFFSTHSFEKKEILFFFSKNLFVFCFVSSITRLILLLSLCYHRSPVTFNFNNNNNVPRTETTEFLSHNIEKSTTQPHTSACVFCLVTIPNCVIVCW